MAPVFKKAISWLGLVDDERIEELDLPVEPEPPAEPPRAARAAAPQEPEPTEFHGDNSQTVLLNQHLLVAPAGYNSVRPIADRYQAGLPTLMDLRSMPIDEAKRCVDFFSGMIFALDGSIKRVAKGIFLLVPQGASVDPGVVEQVLADLQ